jgi:hypothetical protein
MTYYNKEISKAKLSSWSRYCQDISDVPGSARLIRIMAEQETNSVSTIKLSDGQYMQTEREILSELFIDHFPDSELIVGSGGGQD